jgi:hypothetical protein
MDLACAPVPPAEVVQDDDELQRAEAELQIVPYVGTSAAPAHQASAEEFDASQARFVFENPAFWGMPGERQTSSSYRSWVRELVGETEGRGARWVCESDGTECFSEERPGAWKMFADPVCPGFVRLYWWNAVSHEWFYIGRNVRAC